MTVFQTCRCIAFLLLISSCKTSIYGFAKQNLPGLFISVDNKFEKSSNLTLNRDSTFIYAYKLGGCQDLLRGSWKMVDKEVILNMNILNDSIAYRLPNLNQIGWIITSRGLKPNVTIDNGCFLEKGLHKRGNVNY